VNTYDTGKGGFPYGEATVRSVGNREEAAEEPATKLAGYRDRIEFGARDADRPTEMLRRQCPQSKYRRGATLRTAETAPVSQCWQ